MSHYANPEQPLSPQARDMHWALLSLKEEMEAIDWYNYRADLCEDKTLKAILEHNRDEEKEHGAMLLEWIRRTDSRFSQALTEYLCTELPISHK